MLYTLNGLGIRWWLSFSVLDLFHPFINELFPILLPFDRKQNTAIKTLILHNLKSSILSRAILRSLVMLMILNEMLLCMLYDNIRRLGIEPVIIENVFQEVNFFVIHGWIESRIYRLRIHDIVFVLHCLELILFSILRRRPLVQVVLLCVVYWMIPLQSSITTWYDAVSN